MEAVFLVGAVQSLFFSILVLAKKSRQISDILLGIWLVSLSLTLVIPFLIVNHGSIANTRFLFADIGLFASQPVWFYMYTYYLTSKSNSFRLRTLLHFIPVVAVIFMFFPLFSFTPEQFIDIYTGKQSIPKIVMYGGVPGFGLLYAYIFLSLKRIIVHKKNLKYEFSYEDSIDLKWLENLAYTFIAILLVIVILALTYFFGGMKNAMLLDYLSGLCYVFFVFALGYFGYKQGKIFSHSSVIVENPAYNKNIKSSVSRMIPAADENEKLATQLSKYISEHKPWLNPTLSLHDLAYELNITSHQLTSLLNDYLKTNFYDYINHFRVEEVKKHLKADNNQFTILAIALECGFNSKASFNRIFKQKTGRTPSEFLKSGKD